MGWQPRPWARTLAGAALLQAALLILLSMIVGLGPVGWLAAAGYTAAVCLGLATGLRRAGRISLGPADKVTLARSALVGCVTALVADRIQEPVPLVGLTLAALALDGVDGWVARRTGTSSPLGARFDMEVDAFLLLVLSGCVALQLGPWVLAIGLMRYAFIAAGRMLAWMRTPVPSSWAGKVVAVVQGVVLVVATAGVLPPAVTAVAVAAALAALAWSFGRSVLWLSRTRSETGRGTRPSATPAPAVRV
ncbi:MAG TPA: CDP-alcohol phosphatidyltransferase family protein [Actinophytocola sp.]|uniref:CDP-alcohol phosphatidyltransferase family protein n=1 Tax=Actinophytocola sp. TaxID=1872138 RepID=UPI002DDCDBD2|nr:CDP-alcohol phosphatidyltransferase family protein [Actinophytocola sp.]HEV2781205.1 CDP-alcohol phosphatidyltransferase family protein [Actinophytocola sp.]